MVLSLVRTTHHKPLNQYSLEIYADWLKVNYAAKPYLNAMADLDQIEDMYMADTAVSIVSYFLANAGTWKGETAKRIKKELKAIIDNRNQSVASENREQAYK